jgi:hypothetical protein
MGGELGRALTRAVGAQPDAAHADWRRWAASMSKNKTTSRESGATPVGQYKRGSVAGEVSGAGVLGWLGERSTSERMLRVRRGAGTQSADDTSQEKKDKGKRH